MWPAAAVRQYRARRRRRRTRQTWRCIVLVLLLLLHAQQVVHGWSEFARHELHGALDLRIIPP